MSSLVSIDNEKKIDLTEAIDGDIYDEEKDRSKDEWIDLLIQNAKLAPRREQRADDISRDHGIRLFSRQKKQSVCTICFCLLALTFVYCLQLVAMYNLFRQSQSVKSYVLSEWFEKGFIKAPAVSSDPHLILDDVRLLILKINDSTSFETDITNLPKMGICFTKEGFNYATFNLAAGLTLIYAFLFFDLWNVIMDMPLTRSFPLRERKGILMVVGEVWLVLINSVVTCWLGVIAGNAVLAACGDFYSIINTSLQLFIIIAIDDTILPAIRYLVEESGNLDQNTGELTESKLKELTHGYHYYKPGYGHRMTKNFSHPNPVLRIIAIIAFTAMLAIVFAPLAAVIINAIYTVKPCP